MKTIQENLKLFYVGLKDKEPFFYKNKDLTTHAALIGMMAAHVGLTTCGLTSVPGLLNQAHGRAAVLFSVIAGFSLGIMSGRTAPHTGEQLVRTRLRLLVRSALLLVLGAVLSTFGTMVAIILGYYAA